jgi:hypothetical protein
MKRYVIRKLGEQEYLVRQDCRYCNGEGFLRVQIGIEKGGFGQMINRICRCAVLKEKKEQAKALARTFTEAITKIYDGKSQALKTGKPNI